MNIDKKIAQMEEMKNNMISSIKDYSYQQLNQQPNEKEWSIVQVISHLLDAEIGIEYYIDKRVAKINTLKKTGLKNLANSKLLNTVFKSKRKFKAPKAVSNPANNRSFEELSSEWDNSRIKLIQTLKSIPQKHYNKAIWKHPYAGELNTAQVIDFFTNHILHHQHQIKRIKKSL